jgi:hypothetical protein
MRLPRRGCSGSLRLSSALAMISAALRAQKCSHRWRRARSNPARSTSLTPVVAQKGSLLASFLRARTVALGWPAPLLRKAPAFTKPGPRRPFPLEGVPVIAEEPPCCSTPRGLGRSSARAVGQQEPYGLAPSPRPRCRCLVPHTLACPQRNRTTCTIRHRRVRGVWMNSAQASGLSPGRLPDGVVSSGAMAAVSTKRPQLVSQNWRPRAITELPTPHPSLARSAPQLTDRRSRAC